MLEFLIQLLGPRHRTCVAVRWVDYVTGFCTCMWIRSWRIGTSISPYQTISKRETKSSEETGIRSHGERSEFRLAVSLIGFNNCN